VIRIYHNLNKEEISILQQQTQPTSEGLIQLIQGEWILTSGDDKNHTIISFGRSLEACRYWLIYDPIKKLAAATHLDLLTDAEVLEEMVSTLVRNGSNESDLQIRGSSNGLTSNQKKVAELYPAAVLVLNDSDFKFDVQTGELTYPTGEELSELYKMNKDRAIDATYPLRYYYQIGAVKCYQSPELKK